MFKRHFEGALLTDEFVCSKYKLETHKLFFFFFLIYLETLFKYLRVLKLG